MLQFAVLVDEREVHRIAAFAVADRRVLDPQQQVQVTPMPAQQDACLEPVVDRAQHDEVVLVLYPFVAIAVELRCLFQRVQKQVAEGQYRARTGNVGKQPFIAVHDVRHGICGGLQRPVLRVAQEVLSLLNEAVAGPWDS